MKELTPKSKKFHEEEIAKLLDTGMTFEQIENSGTKLCSGLTLQIGDFWYSIACLYDRNINFATAGYCSTDGMNGLQGKCRGCMRHHNTLQVCQRRTFDNPNPKILIGYLHHYHNKNRKNIKLGFLPIVTMDLGLVWNWCYFAKQELI
jgi:hypothetical protein